MTLMAAGDDEKGSNRLPEILAALPNLSAFSREVGISRRMLDRYKGGLAEPTLSTAALIARALDVPVDALVSDAIVQSAANLDKSDASDSKIARVPLLDVVASAGPGAENSHPYELELLPFPRVWLDRLGVPEKYARFVDARGDSMEPTIKDGSICLVDTRAGQARKDGIYVLVDGSSVRIKRIAIGWQGALTLISDNERYATETLSAPDAESLRIAGRVVWAGGEI